MRSNKKIAGMAAVMCFAMMCVLSIMNPLDVAAKSKSKLPDKNSTTFVGEQSTYDIVTDAIKYDEKKVLFYLPKGTDIISVKVSNEKLVAIKVCYGWGDFHIKALKPGKTKITVKYKRGGKQKTYTFNLQIFKYQSPFDSFKLGEQDFAKFFGQLGNKPVEDSSGFFKKIYNYDDPYEIPKKKVKKQAIMLRDFEKVNRVLVSWSAKSGYRIVSVKLRDDDDKLHKIKNGQMLSPWDDLWRAECYYSADCATSIVVTYTIDKDKSKTKYKSEILIPDVVNDYE